MSESWRNTLQFDPIPILLGGKDPALTYYTQLLVLQDPVADIQSLWDHSAARKLIDKQQVNGSWRYPGKNQDQFLDTNYHLLETYRTLRKLVEMYGFDRRHPGIEMAATYIFSCQTPEGDIRGILGNQYMPYYHGGILTLLIKAGFANDPRTLKGLEWLLGMRQEDGGWIVPAQALPPKQKTPQFWPGPVLPPDRSQPASHLATDMVLRAFAAHPDYRCNKHVLGASRILICRLFQPDRYNDRQGKEYWLKFQYPFWWHSLVSALDSLSFLGYDRNDEQIEKGLEWFSRNQSRDGLWETRYGNGAGAAEMRLWVGLSICRVLKRYLD
jgi:hypothetical protein